MINVTYAQALRVNKRTHFRSPDYYSSHAHRRIAAYRYRDGLLVVSYFPAVKRNPHMLCETESLELIK